MTATESIIGEKLGSVRQALHLEQEKVKELRAVEHALEDVLGAEDTKQSAPELSSDKTLKQIVASTLETAGRPVSVKEIEQVVRSAKGASTRKQGIYSTLHEMVKHRAAKRVRPGVYKVVSQH